MQRHFETCNVVGNGSVRNPSFFGIGHSVCLLVAIFAFVVIGTGIPGVEPFANQLHASHQSEPADPEPKPVGPLPEWTQVDHREDATSTRLVIASDIRHYEREAIEELWSHAIEAVSRRLDEKVAAGAGRLVQVDRAMIKQKLLVPGHSHTHVYQTPVPVSVDPADGSMENQHRTLEWHRCFIELDFNDSFNEWAKIEYERRIVESRVGQTALVVLSGFLLLVVLFGFLKFNHRTQGVYAGRLQSIAIIAAIVVIIAALALSNSIVWL